MSGQVSRGSAGEYQADERAGVARLSWRVSGRGAGTCRAAQLASIRQMTGHVSRGSAGECNEFCKFNTITYLCVSLWIYAEAEHTYLIDIYCRNLQHLKFGDFN